jgi:prefoldin subunit 5
MKYLLPFFIFIICGLVAVTIIQYNKINDLEEKIKTVDEKLPKYGEAMNFLESKINQLERELGMQQVLQKTQQGSSTIQPTTPSISNQQMINDMNKVQPSSTPSFQDMQPKH